MIPEAVVGAGEHVLERAPQVEVAAEDDGERDAVSERRMREADERGGGPEAEGHDADASDVDGGMRAEAGDDSFEIRLVAGAEAVLSHLLELRRHHDEPGARETAAERLQPRVGGALVREAVRHDDGGMPASARGSGTA